jgi:hypothetical protein
MRLQPTWAANILSNPDGIGLIQVQVRSFRAISSARDFVQTRNTGLCGWVLLVQFVGFLQFLSSTMQFNGRLAIKIMDSWTYPQKFVLATN